MRVLIYDLETQPTLGYVWSAWKQNMAPVQVVDHGKVICWAAKWMGEKKIMFGAEWTPEINGQHFIERLYELMNEADAVLTYNGDSFDQRVFNTELLKRRLPHVAPSKSIDMFKVVKKRFRLFHSRMDTVAQALGLEGKTQTGGFELWKDVMAGKKKAQKLMEKYNRQDIIVLENIYHALRGWIPNHPNTDNNNFCCPGEKFQKRGFHYTKVSKFQRYQCQGCGSWHRGRENLLKKNDKPEIVSL